MADVKKTVEVVFGAVDNFSGRMDGMSKGIGSFTSSIAGGTKTLLKFEAGVATAGAAMAATAIVAAGKFHDSFAEITTLVDAPQKAIGNLRAEILRYGSTSTQSLKDVTDATYSALSAGTNYKDITQALTGAEKLAVAGNASMNESIKLLSGTMNAYGADVSQTSKYSDIFFQTVKLGVTTIPELSASMSQVTPVSSQLGIGIGEVGAAMADMTAKGTPTAQAATQLKALLLALIKPSTGSAKAMKDMGLNFSLAEIKAHGLSGVLDQLSKATGGSAEKLNLLIPSSEGAAAAAQLLANNSQAYINKLDAIKNSAGSTDVAFKKMSDNFGNHNQKILNSINTTLVRVGSDLLPAYGSVADAVAGVFAAFGSAVDAGALSAITTQVQQWAEGLVGFLENAAKLLPAALDKVNFQPLLDAIGGVGSALGGMFDGVNAGSADALAAMIQSVIDAMTGFVTVTEGIFSALGLLADAVVAAVDVWNSMDTSLQQLIGTIGGMALVISALSPAISATVAALGLFGDAARGVEASSNKLTGALGKAGLLGAAAAAGYGIGSMIEKSMGQNARNAIQDFIGVLDRVTGGMITNSDAAKAYAQQPAPFDKATIAAIDNADAIQKTAAEMQVMIKASTDAGISEADYADKMALVTKNALEKSKAVKQAAAADSKQADSTKANIEALRALGAEINTAKDATKQYIKVVGSDGGVSYQNNPFYIAGEAAKGAVKEISKVDQAVVANKLEAEKLRLEWDKQRNQTIVKTLEIKSKVDIAQINADSKAITSSFDSINVGLKTSSDLLSSMFGALNKSTSSWDRSTIEASIRKEQEIRKREVDSQIKLNDSIIEMNKLKAERMRNNVNPVLTVSAPDLSVELELVLLKILEKLQIKGNASGMDMLLQGL